LTSNFINLQVYGQGKIAEGALNVYISIANQFDVNQFSQQIFALAICLSGTKNKNLKTCCECFSKGSMR